MTPIGTVPSAQPKQITPAMVRAAVAAGYSGDIAMHIYRIMEAAAPVVQVVEPLTWDDLVDAPDPAYVTSRDAFIVQACARKWGLSLKENT